MFPRARRDDVSIEILGDELAVFIESQDRAYRLGKGAALVWQYCDGKTSVTELTKRVARKLGPESADETLVLEVLGALERADLICGWHEPPDPVGQRSWHRLSMLGVIPLLVPAAASVVAHLPSLNLLHRGA